MTIPPDTAVVCHELPERDRGEMFLPFENTWDLYEIGPDYVLGKIEDEFDVEHIRMYGLTREPGARGP